MDKRFPLEDQIEMLGSMIRGRVVAPHHVDFDAMRLVAVAQFDHLRPAAIVRVASPSDVATVLNFAQATDLPVAVRAGGHSTGGHGVADGALVIDLRDLKGIEIDAEARTVWAGAGCTAGEVTTTVEKHGLIVGFGDSGSVGIAGLTLGGGIGYLVRKHGLTIDSLLAVEIVTAAGDILVANETNHADLFWAVRGGGGNFGVITRFKYRLHPLPAFTGGPLVYPPVPEIIAGFAALAEQAPEELSTIAMIMPLPPAPFVPAEFHGKPAFVAMMAYAGDDEAAQRALAPFRALATPVADLVAPGPFSSLYMMDPPPEARAMVSVRSRFSNRFGIEEARALVAAAASSTAPMSAAQIRVLGGAHARVAADGTAFAHRDSRFMISFLAMYGGGPDVITEQERWATDSVTAVAPASSGAYVNFLGHAEGDVGFAAAYPAATLSRLRRVKRQYDPENLFRLNTNVTPA
ncbi:MAG TPA: FAD-binding oxidoreductase [Devosia sp.]|jgi:FAD/FMN-containing dehydrogenase|nr:FAD-binding oxidoreductase [Devosia sp.]